MKKMLLALFALLLFSCKPFYHTHTLPYGLSDAEATEIRNMIQAVASRNQDECIETIELKSDILCANPRKSDSKNETLARIHLTFKTSKKKHNEIRELLNAIKLKGDLIEATNIKRP